MSTSDCGDHMNCTGDHGDETCRCLPGFAARHDRSCGEKPGIPACTPLNTTLCNAVPCYAITTQYRTSCISVGAHVKNANTGSHTVVWTQIYLTHWQEWVALLFGCCSLMIRHRYGEPISFCFLIGLDPFRLSRCRTATPRK